MIQTSPKQIRGEWASGYALDMHTLSSECIGYNEYGHAQFDTKRSEMGELLYRLKYKSDRSVLKIIIDVVAGFVNSKGWQADVLIPVPPSSTTRSFQPVLSIAKGVSNLLNLRLCQDCVVKVKETPELKNVYELDKRMELLKDAYAIVRREVVDRKILLFDDLYRSGATLNAISQALKQKGKVKDVYAITLTMTRRTR